MWQVFKVLKCTWYISKLKVDLIYNVYSHRGGDLASFDAKWRKHKEQRGKRETIEVCEARLQREKQRNQRTTK